MAHADSHAIVLHPLSNLSRTYAWNFVINLKLTFIYGKGKSGLKFHELRRQVTNSLPTAPRPGPATFVMHCLETLLFIEPPYNEGLSHLLTSALNHLSPVDRPSEDAAIACKLAASLLYKTVMGMVSLEARIVVRLVVVFGIQLKDIQETLDIHMLEKGHTIEEAKAFLEPFVLNLINTRLYNPAVSLLKQFDLQDFVSQDFLVTMVLDGQSELAGQWAAYLGRDMICFLVQYCTDIAMFKMAHKFVQHYHLQKDFPDSRFLYRKSSLCKLVEKGLWEVAETIANEDPQLPEYLATLAIEEGDLNKATEICNRFQLKGFPLHPVTVKKEGGFQSQFIQLKSIIPEDRIVFVDSFEGLDFAEKHLINAKVVGIDCEWRANWLKGKQPNKVSILQVATSEIVFIFDLISLYEKEPTTLDKCMKSVFHSTNILKLGYALCNDLERLLESYQDLECFTTCESILDLQKVVGKAVKGGLSGLAKAALGSYLDKRMRMSNWEERPLSIRQLHYAALDALVLLSIFDCIRSASRPYALESLPDWKTQVMSFRSLANKLKAGHTS